METRNTEQTRPSAGPEARARVLRSEFDADGNTREVTGLLTGSVIPDGDGWAASCRELDLAVGGATAEGALGGIQDAVRQFLARAIEERTLEASLTKLGWRCDLPDVGLVDCRRYPIPERLLPEWTLDPIERSGSEWFQRVRFREEVVTDEGHHASKLRRFGPGSVPPRPTLPPGFIFH